MIRRAFRFLFAAATWLSLLLCALAGTAWVRGYFASDTLKLTQGWEDPPVMATDDEGHEIEELGTSHERQWVATSSLGLIGLAFQASTDASAGDPPWTWETARPPSPIMGPPVPGVYGGSGFYCFNVSYALGMGQQIDIRGVIARAWAVALALAVLPAFGVARWRRRRRLARRLRDGLCVRCGYDLRESPGNCPECGAAPPAA